MISDSNDADAYSPDVEVIATSTGLPASFGGDDTTELPFALRDDAQDQEGYFDFDWFGSKRNKIIVGLSTFLLVLCLSTGTGIAVKNKTVSNFAVLEEDCPEPLLISSAKGSKAPSTAKAKSKAPSSASAEDAGGTNAHTTPGSKCSKSTKSSKSSKSKSSKAPSSQPSLGPSESGKPSTKPSLVPSGLPSTKPSLAPSEFPSAKPSLVPSAKPSLSSVPSELPSASAKPSLSLVPSAKPSSSLVPSAKPSLSLVPSAKPSLSLVPSELPSASAKPSLSLVPSESPSASAKPSLSLVPSESPSTSTKPTVTCIATGEFCDRAPSGGVNFCRTKACCAGIFTNCNTLTNASGLYCGRSSCPATNTRIASGKFCGRNAADDFCASACGAGNSQNCPNSPLPGRYCDSSVACSV